MIMAYKEMQCLEMWVKVKIEKLQNDPCLISHSFSVMMSFPMSLWLLCPGGGGGTQMLFGRGCEAEASKPVPIFKGHFGRKGTHY